MNRILKKFGILLDRKQKQKVIFIIFLMLIGAFLETMSVSLVIPLMTALMQDNFIETNELAIFACNLLGIHSSKTFILLVLAALIVLFIVKDAFLYMEYHVQATFVAYNKTNVQNKLMDSYVHRPYEYFLNASSGEIMRVIRSDAAGAFALLTLIMGFFTEAIVAVALMVAVIATDPGMAATIAAILIAMMALIYKVVKPVLRKEALSLQDNNATANKWLLQSVSGIKEMKVVRKEKFFVDEYTKYAKGAVESDKVISVLNNAPRLIIEASTISGMLLYIAIMIYAGKNISDLLPQLTAFAVAAVRLLPSANRMSTALNGIAYGEPLVDKTLENLRIADEYNEQGKKLTEQQSKNKTPITFEKECGLSNIEFTYPNAEKKVLDHASMVIPVGKSVGIIGPSGAGKTTAVDILLGLLKPQGGMAYADGKNIEENYDGWLKHLAYIPQMIYMLDDTIRANIAFGYHENEIDDAKVWKALDEAQMGDYVRSLPEGLDTTIGERGVRLSGGQRQRIGIARALYEDPELLIFDEATSALDNETEAAIMESVNSLHGKKTMIIIAHRLSTIKECDIVYRVENGKINQVDEIV